MRWMLWKHKPTITMEDNYSNWNDINKRGFKFLKIKGNYLIYTDGNTIVRLKKG